MVSELQNEQEKLDEKNQAVTKDLKQQIQKLQEDVKKLKKDQDATSKISEMLEKRDSMSPR